MTRGLTCDLCGAQQNDFDDSYYDWTTINLGTKLIGHRDYQDVCPPCTVWLISKLDDERSRQNK